MLVLQFEGGGGDAGKFRTQSVHGQSPSRNRKTKPQKGSKNSDGRMPRNKDASPAGAVDMDTNWRQKRSSLSPAGHGTPNSTPKSSPYSSPRSSPMVSPTMARRRISHGKSPLAATENYCQSPKVSPENGQRKISSGAGASWSDGSPSGSPWIQRRLKAHADSTSSLPGISPGTSPLLGRKTDLDRIKRQPRGPDGTVGFHIGAGRGKSFKKSNEEVIPGKPS